MKKILSILTVSALLGQIAIASEETKYVKDQTAQGLASDMASRALLQAEVITVIDFAPLIGLLIYTSSTAIMPEMNIIELDLVTQQRFNKMRDALQEGLGLTSAGTSVVAQATSDSVKNAVQAVAQKIKEEKAAFYANGQVDVAQTPTLFRAANEVALVKGVDTNAAAAVIISNSESILEILNK